MSRAKGVLLGSLTLLLAALLIAPATAFAVVQPFATTQPGGSGTGGGKGEVWPWGWGMVTAQNGVTWGDDTGDQYVMFTRAPTYISVEATGGGLQSFLAFVDKNPSINAPYLKLKKDGVYVPDFQSHVGTPARNYPTIPLPGYIGADGWVYPSTNNGWWIPVTNVPLDPGCAYELSFLRGMKANNSMTNVIYTDGLGTELGYIQQNGSLTYPDENDQYTAKQFDTFLFRNPYLGTYEEFTFRFQTYADTGAFGSALATAESALATATANAGTAPGQVDPARVAYLASAVASATAAAPTMNEQLQPQVDAAVTQLADAVAQAQVLNPEVVAPTTTIYGVSSGWATGSVTFSLEATGGTPPLTTSYQLDSGAPALYSGPVTVSAEGTTVVWFFSVDSGGRHEDTRTADIRIDSVAPVTSADGIPEDTVATPVTVTLSAHDLTSGLAQTFCSLDGAAPAPYAEPIVVSTPGAHSLEYWSVDVAGNVEPARRESFRISAGPPTSILSGVPSTWSTVPVTFSIEATGDAPPVSALYALGAGDLTAYSAPVHVSAEGTTALAYLAVDSLGRRQATHTADIRIDTVAPATALSGLAGDVVLAPARISLSATDLTSGVAETLVSLDGAPASPYGGPIAVSDAGAHSISYWSRDVAGNNEGQHTRTFRVSAGPPTSSISGVPATWTASPVTFSIAATGDAPPISSLYALNGAAPVAYTAPVLVTAEGSTLVSYRSLDALGQSETTRTATVRIDSLPPTSTIAGLPAGGVASGTVTFSLAASDAGSGVASIRYLLDSTQPTSTYTGPVAVTSAGTHAVTWWAVDAVGNAETAHTAAFRISAGPPSSSVAGIPSGWSRTPVTFSLAATCDVPPIVTYYALDGGPLAPYGSPVQVSAEGVTALAYRATDAIGQAEALHSTQIRIDSVAPQTTSDAVASYVGTASIHLTATDAAGGSGVAHTYFRLDGAAAVEGTDVSTSVVGSHTVEFHSDDVAGNVEVTHGTASFAVTPPPDVIPPTTTSDAGGEAYLVSATIHLTASDNQYGSGVAHTYYRLDGSAQAEGTVIIASGWGRHSLEFWSVDAVGNEESPHQTASFFINEHTPPVTSADARGSYVGEAIIYLTAVDNAGGSGVRQTYYRLDGGPQTQGTMVRTSVVGTHTLEFWSVDLANNAETPPKSCTFTLSATDVTPPTTVSDAGASYTGSATIHLYATDDPGGSGVVRTLYRLDSGGDVEGTTIVTSVVGTHTVQFWSVDAAGNVEAAHTASFTVVAAVKPTSITIKSNAYTTYIGKTPILSGAVTPAQMVGVNIVVYVMKPGKTYWTYSSNRTVYSLNGSPAWQYKYYFKKGMARGTYKFKASAPAPGFASSAGFLPSSSTVISVRVK